METKVLFFLLVFLASGVNNLVIPFAIYYKKYGFFRKRRKEFIGCNGWGIVMDGILAGVINIVALNFLLTVSVSPTPAEIKIAVAGGLISTIITHILMSIGRWKIWIMPDPWHWNEAGYWHMVSMTLQMSFVFYTLVIMVNHPFLWGQRITQFSLLLGVFLAGLFLFSLYQSQKGIRIGRFHLDYRPW